MEKATFGAGCFWGVQAAFKKLHGVISTTVGYMGGDYQNPTYEDVCSDKTGHAEVVEVVYDPKKIGYEELLATFWDIHNPTTFNRQGPDVGSQYRSVIFFYSEDQKNKALDLKEKLQKSNKYKKDIVTNIEPAGKFWKAEDYHQNYFDKNSNAACNIHF